MIEWKLRTIPEKVPTSTTKNIFPTHCTVESRRSNRSASKWDDEIKNMLYSIKQCNF